jgi:hypothetical protein
MNLRYLGDALDHWKGSPFERLQRARLLRSFAVDAMATDAEDWQSTDLALFADLLRIEQPQILRHKHLLEIDRRGYFSEITHEGDLFLDPDTGSATGKVGDASQYMFAKEVHGLLTGQPARVLAVYQHIRAQKTRDRLQRVISTVKLPDQPFTCCSYESGTVAMLFFSREDRRIGAIHRHFLDYLGRHAPGRIYRWRHLQGDIS